MNGDIHVYFITFAALIDGVLLGCVSSARSSLHFGAMDSYDFWGLYNVLYIVTRIFCLRPEYGRVVFF